MKVSRKMDALVRFYKQTISNERISHRTRMQAAARLSEIYERAELLHEKNAARAERAELRAAAQREPGGAVPAQESPSEVSELNEDEAISSVFGSLLRGKVVSSDDTDSE